MKIDIPFLLLKAYIHTFKKPEIQRNIDPDSVQTILVVSNTAIGDTLFATPAIRAIKTAYPDKKVIALLNPSNASLFETNPHIDEVVTYDGRWGSFFKTFSLLKNKNIDLAFLLHSNDPQATPLCYLAGIKHIIKIPNHKNEWRELHSNPPTPPVRDQHGIYDRLNQLKFLGINADDPRMELFITEEWQEQADSLLNIQENELLIGFQVGASTVSRMWFEDRWIELGKKVLQNFPNARIVLTGAPHERRLAESIEAGIGSERVFNATGKLSLGAAAALLGKLKLLVTPDTGPLHIAAALGVPTITLFAVADPVKSNPCYDEAIHVYIKKPLTCEPCVGKRCKYQKCMLQIEPDEVMGEMMKLVDRLQL